MFAIVYVSRATIDWSEEALKALAKQASEANARFGITGYLSFRKGRFFQYLEGDEPTVRRLMERLRTDTRHEIQRELNLGTHRDPLFSDWSMRFLQDRELIDIQVEDLLDGAMLSMTQPAFDEEQTIAMVRRLVEAVARFRLQTMDVPPTDRGSLHMALADILPEVGEFPMVVGIGASAGGLVPIGEFFERVPSDLGIPYVVIQHLSPQSESFMDTILAPSNDRCL